jgi:hypothetical protein
MDIKGAKALKRRLGLDGADEAPTPAKPADIPADAPPVYHWTGVGKSSDATPSAEAEEEIAPRSASLFSRLRLSFHC